MSGTIDVPTTVRSIEAPFDALEANRDPGDETAVGTEEALAELAEPYLAESLA